MRSRNEGSTLPSNAFVEDYLALLNERDEPVTAPEADYAGPWSVEPRRQGGHAVLRAGEDLGRGDVMASLKASRPDLRIIVTGSGADDVGAEIRKQRLKRDETGQRHGRGLLEAEVIGNWNNLVPPRRQQFAVAAVRPVTSDAEFPAETLLPGRTEMAAPAKHHRRQHYPLPFTKLAGLLAHPHNLPGNVAAVNVRQGRIPHSLSQPHIQMVQGAGPHPHQHFIAAQ